MNEHLNNIFSKYLCGFRNDHDVHFCPLPSPLALLGSSEIFFLKTRSTSRKLYLQIYMHFLYFTLSKIFLIFRKKTN